MPKVDLNGDLGEGSPNDGDLLDLLSSASISCGAHAGDERTMRLTIDAALKRRVLVGAHPGYPDRAGFGRREMGASPAEIRAMMLEQLGAFAAACADTGAGFTHMKPHGALYNRAMVDVAAADSIARAVIETDPSVVVLCMPGSALHLAAEDAGLRVAREAFLDRAYQSARRLVPRTDPGALASDPDAAADAAERMVLESVVTSVDGMVHPIHPDSLCVHGDNPDAVLLLRAVRERLQSRGVTIAPFARR
ncbi:MAG TPA: 5-oxoprolinase subunit PxpA [Gemmatimonadaceae bacterium]|nr:5-oxoprolinase subunit PxpA [Gemmatimonadaceae bacterium]